MFYVGGVDEAGRGPVLGPMVMSIVAAREIDIQAFNKMGVKDSKMVPHLKRVKLARLIRNQCPHITIKVPPSEIDQALRSETSSLNELEAKTTARLIIRLAKLVNCKEIMLDLPSKNKEAYLVFSRQQRQRFIRQIAANTPDKSNKEFSSTVFLVKLVAILKFKSKCVPKLRVIIGLRLIRIIRIGFGPLFWIQNF